MTAHIIEFPKRKNLDDSELSAAASEEWVYSHADMSALQKQIIRTMLHEFSAVWHTEGDKQELYNRMTGFWRQYT